MILSRLTHYIRAVAAYLKVVRRRKPSSAEGTRGGRAREGDYSPSRKGGFGGPLPRIFLNFERFCVRFNGGFRRFGPDFCRFGHNLLLEKIFLVA